MTTRLFAPVEAIAPARARDLAVRLAGAGDAAPIKAFIRAHHSTLPSPPAGWRAAFLAIDDNQAVWAVATWGRPTSRKIDAARTLELTRLAVRAGAPRNTATRFMAACRPTLRRLYPGVTTLISYQDCDVHTGGIYRADNWRVVYDRQVKPATWTNRPGRAASERTRRSKWERDLR